MSHLTFLAAKTNLSHLVLPVGRKELFVWLASALFANRAIQLLDFDSFSGLAQSLAVQNYIYWFGCYVTLYRIGKSDALAPATNADWYLAFAIMLATLLSSFIASRFPIGIIATMFALYLMLRYSDRELKAAGIMLFALSAHLVWGPILFQFLTPELLRADAALVGSMLRVVRPDVIWNDTFFQTTPNFAISLVGGCSSFHNLSTALLACAAATMFLRTYWTRQDFIKVAAAIVVMILLNDARLCLLAWGPTSYEFWHNGTGGPLFGFLMTATLLIVAFWGAPASRSDRT